MLRCFGATIGAGCRVYPGVRLWAPWNLVMGDGSVLADGVDCYSMATVTLGARAIVSQGGHLCAGGHDYESRNFQLVAEPISIGAHAWLCAGAFVGPGVTVGAGAVIGARAVVVKDMPAWTVCAGNPCRPLKPRLFRPESAGGPKPDSAAPWKP